MSSVIVKRKQRKADSESPVVYRISSLLLEAYRAAGSDGPSWCLPALGVSGPDLHILQNMEMRCWRWRCRLVCFVLRGTQHHSLRLSNLSCLQVAHSTHTKPSASILVRDHFLW